MHICRSRKTPRHSIPVCATTIQTVSTPKRTVRSVHFDDTPLESLIEVINLPATEFAPAQTPHLLAALLREVEQLPEINDFGDDEIDHDRKDTFAPFRNNPEGDTDMIDKITICGTPEQQQRIRALCVNNILQTKTNHKTKWKNKNNKKHGAM